MNYTTAKILERMYLYSCRESRDSQMSKYTVYFTEVQFSEILPLCDRGK